MDRLALARAFRDSRPSAFSCRAALAIGMFFRTSLSQALTAQALRSSGVIVYPVVGTATLTDSLPYSLCESVDIATTVPVDLDLDVSILVWVDNDALVTPAERTIRSDPEIIS